MKNFHSTFETFKIIDAMMIKTSSLFSSAATPVNRILIFEIHGGWIDFIGESHTGLVLHLPRRNDCTPHED